MTDAVLVEAPVTGFATILARQLRAHDAHDAWAKKSDAQILAPFLLTKEQRKAIPIVGDPSKEVLWRLDVYYAAIAMAIEAQTGTICAPLLKLSHEGFGRVILTAGKLVVLSRSLRDVHRFGFDGLADLVAKSEKLVAEGAENVRAYPDLVDA